MANNPHDLFNLYLSFYRLLLRNIIRFDNFHGQILQQQEGYGFTNIPSWAEVSEMKKEYIANNPDWKENLPKWGEELPER